MTDLGELPVTTERRPVLVYVPGTLRDPVGRWKYQEQDVQVVNLTGSPLLRAGDSLSFTTTLAS